jgi:hypothetical protein
MTWPRCLGGSALKRGPSGVKPRREQAVGVSTCSAFVAGGGPAAQWSHLHSQHDDGRQQAGAHDCVSLRGVSAVRRPQVPPLPSSEGPLLTSLDLRIEGSGCHRVAEC